MAAGLLLGLHPGVTPLTGMLALTAGGASGLVAVSRDLGGDDRVVAVVQYLRVGIVTATMPLIALSALRSVGASRGRCVDDSLASSLIAALGFGATTGGCAAATPGGSVPGALGFLVVCTAAGLGLAALIRLPAGGLLGPMAVAIALTISGLWSAAAPPDAVVELAYAVIGWQAGVRFTRDSLRTVITVLPLASLLIVAIIAACAGLGLLLSAATGTTVLEGYLATTPGGVYAVLATAISAGGDVTFVVATQVLRVIVMLLVAPVLARFAR
jgi:membrane AbrB-like protein